MTINPEEFKLLMEQMEKEEEAREGEVLPIVSTPLPEDVGPHENPRMFLPEEKKRGTSTGRSMFSPMASILERLKR